MLPDCPGDPGVKSIFEGGPPPAISYFVSNWIGMSLIIWESYILTVNSLFVKGTARGFVGTYGKGMGKS